MSLRKHNENEVFDTGAWILAGIIAILTAIDLLVWVALQNGYNPVDRGAAASRQKAPVSRATEIAEAHQPPL
jgi:hypothetical protein